MCFCFGSASYRCFHDCEFNNRLWPLRVTSATSNKLLSLTWSSMLCTIVFSSLFCALISRLVPSSVDCFAQESQKFGSIISRKLSSFEPIMWMNFKWIKLRIARMQVQVTLGSSKTRFLWIWSIREFDSRSTSQIRKIMQVHLRCLNKSFQVGFRSA